jgi:phospholipid/cholesterol/gamma-HCH transport system substrate-binding protein
MTAQVQGRRPARRAPRIKPVKERNPVAVAFAGLAVLSVLGLLAYNVQDLPFIGSGTTYSADFSEAAGLREGDEVRIAGVKVGEVTGVSLDGAKVKVTFDVKDAWIQSPDVRIPLSRTTSPYDVTQAFQDLGGTIDDIDTKQLAASFETISETFADSPAHVRKAATGLSALSRTVSKRDQELADLLKGSSKFTKTLKDQKSSFETLIDDGGPLLGELTDRRDAIKALLTGSRNLGKELRGLVDDNDKQLGPTLKALGRVTGVLEDNSDQLDRTLALVGPYYRLVGNTLGSGRWFDSYLCGVVPPEYLPEPSRPRSGCVPPRMTGAGQSASTKGGRS